MDALRKRTPFKSTDDEAEQEDIRILDEQEQEEVIEELRRSSEASNNQFLIALRIIIGISAFFHVAFLISPHLVLSLLLTIRIHDSPIILSRLFALVHISVHLNVLLILFKSRDSSPGHSNSGPGLTTSTRSSSSTQGRADNLPSWIADAAPYLPVPFAWSFGLSVFAPVISVASSKAWQQSAWWSTAFCLAIVSSRILAWIDEGEENLRRLEGLQYNAKGA